jgi:hypothetical protein
MLGGGGKVFKKVFLSRYHHLSLIYFSIGRNPNSYRRKKAPNSFELGAFF